MTSQQAHRFDVASGHRIRQRRLSAQLSIERTRIALQQLRDGLDAIEFDRLEDVDRAAQDHVPQRRVAGVVGPSGRRAAVLVFARVDVGAAPHEHRTASSLFAHAAAWSGV